MMRIICIALLLVAGTTPLLAQKGKSQPKGKTDLQKQRAALYKKRGDIARQQYALRGKIAKHKDAAQLRQAWQDAMDKQQAKFQELSKKQRAIADAAKKKYYQLVADKIAKDKTLGEWREQLETFADNRAVTGFAIAQAQLKLQHYLSPLHRQVEKDADVRKAKQDLNAGKKDAWKKYYDLRKAKLAALPEAKKLNAEIKQQRDKIRDIDKDVNQLNQKISSRRRAFFLDKEEAITAARKKYNELTRAVWNVYRDEDLRKLQQQASEARTRWQQKITELLAKDPQYKALREQADKLQKELQALESKARKATSK